jgi:hypothetical protein
MISPETEAEAEPLMRDRRRGFSRLSKLEITGLKIVNHGASRVD